MQATSPAGAAWLSLLWSLSQEPHARINGLFPNDIFRDSEANLARCDRRDWLVLCGVDPGTYYFPDIGRHFTCVGSRAQGFYWIAVDGLNQDSPMRRLLDAAKRWAETTGRRVSGVWCVAGRCLGPSMKFPAKRGEREGEAASGTEIEPRMLFAEGAVLAYLDPDDRSKAYYFGEPGAPEHPWLVASVPLDAEIPAPEAFETNLSPSDIDHEMEQLRDAFAALGVDRDELRAATEAELAKPEPKAPVLQALTGINFEKILAVEMPKEMDSITSAGAAGFELAVKEAEWRRTKDSYTRVNLVTTVENRGDETAERYVFEMVLRDIDGRPLAMDSWVQRVLTPPGTTTELFPRLGQRASAVDPTTIDLLVDIQRVVRVPLDEIAIGGEPVPHRVELANWEAGLGVTGTGWMTVEDDGQGRFDLFVELDNRGNDPIVGADLQMSVTNPIGEVEENELPDLIPLPLPPGEKVLSTDRLYVRPEQLAAGNVVRGVVRGYTRLANLRLSDIPLRPKGDRGPTSDGGVGNAR